MDYHPINVHNLIVLSPAPASPPPSSPHRAKENPGLGFFFKIHLLESLKLELYDLCNLEIIHIVLNTIYSVLCVDGF